MKRTEIEQLLPIVFQRTVRPGNPHSALLEVMEAMHDPSEKILGRLDAIFNPRHTEDRFVPFLAQWVDLGWLFAEDANERAPTSLSPGAIPFGMGRLRELIAVVVFLSQWRGTARGLLFFLKTATGLEGFEIIENVQDSNGLPRRFHILVRAPASASVHQALIERIIEREKPAYVTYDLEFKE